jgi:hypothetical protein
MIEVPIEILRILYKHYYNPAVDWRDPSEVTRAWREIAEIAMFEEECTCGEDDNTSKDKALPHKTSCIKAGL